VREREGEGREEARERQATKESQLSLLSHARNSGTVPPFNRPKEKKKKQTKNRAEQFRRILAWLA
jgi:hypothetical protein